MKQRFEYQMTGQVHLTGGADALNAIARDGWQFTAMGPGFIIWERPFEGSQTPAVGSADTAEDVAEVVA